MANLILPPLASAVGVEYTTPEQRTHFEAYWSVRFNGDFDLLDKLTDNIRIFTNEYYLNGVDYVASVIDSVRRRGNPVVLIRDDRSGGFLRGHLNQRGVETEYQDYSVHEQQYLEYPPSTVGIVVDDAFYGGRQTGGYVRIFNNRTNVPLNQTMVAVIGGTNQGEDLLRKNYSLGRSSIFRKYGIPVLHELLTKKEINNIVRGFKDWGMDAREVRESVLTMFYYKVPDSFLQVLRRSAQRIQRGPDRYSYLIDDSPAGRFYPPYSTSEVC